MIRQKFTGSYSGPVGLQCNFDIDYSLRNSNFNVVYNLRNITGSYSGQVDLQCNVTHVIIDQYLF